MTAAVQSSVVNRQPVNAQSGTTTKVDPKLLKLAQKLVDEMYKLYVDSFVLTEPNYSPLTISVLQQSSNTVFSMTPVQSKLTQKVNDLIQSYKLSDKEWTAIDFKAEVSQLDSKNQKIFSILRSLVDAVFNDLENQGFPFQTTELYKSSKKTFETFGVKIRMINTFCLIATKFRQ